MTYHAHSTRARRFAGFAVLAVLLGATPALAAPLSGGGSGGGAIEGGSGAPGSGVGIPGAIANNTTAEGIGEDDTLPVARPAGVVAPRPRCGSQGLLSAQPPAEAMNQRFHRFSNQLRT